MLLKSASIRIQSDLPPSIARERLHAAANEWRESTLSPTARDAGILGWVLKDDAERIKLRARVASSTGLRLYFVGQIHQSGTGSCVEGKIRLNWGQRGFTLVWLACAAAVPLLMLVEPIPGATIDDRWIGSIVSLPFSAGLFALGLWMASRDSQPRAAAITELLTIAASNTPAPMA